MGHFTATGTIATDIVRRETRNGVLATFRLAAGLCGRGQVWVDVEVWGHLAGTVYHHATRNQPVVVAGRLTQKNWHDRDTGEARRRLVVTGHDVDLLQDLDWSPTHASTVIAAGVIDSQPTTRPAGNGSVTEFVIRSGRAGTKNGRLWLDVEHWSADHQPAIAVRDSIVVQGRLAYRPPTGDRASGGHHYLAAANLVHTAADSPASAPVR